MKIITVLGTRPEIIRLSQIIPKLDTIVEHFLVHTGQNFDESLSELFFEELSLRPPDYHLGAIGSLSEQVAKMFIRFEEILADIKPDRVLILGDTNSALTGFVAKRNRIPVFHIEAGNRCFDDKVPEEVNRRVIDHCSDVLMPYTERSRANLLHEGFSSERIFVIGNPIGEILSVHRDRINISGIVGELGLQPDHYFLVTLHRAENVDDPDRLACIVSGLRRVSAAFDLPVLVSTHPHTRNRLVGLSAPGSDDNVQFHDPFGFFDFIQLTLNARCVLTDSGTVQEESAILRRPNVTLRDTTERPETIERGSNVLSGAAPDDIVRATRLALSRAADWKPPDEYNWPNVSGTAVQIVTGYFPFIRTQGGDI